MMSFIHRILCLGLFFISAASVAGIQPGSTRVIYPAAKREVTLQIMNNATTPRLIQAWIDRGDSDSPASASSPFFVTPPISRIDPGKGQTLRITFIGGDVPSDRESVFWLNILELQPKTVGQKAGGNNVVQFPIRTRLKVFYRPEGLHGAPEDAINEVRWRVIPAGHNTILECENSTVFSISFQNIQLQGTPSHSQNPIHGMCPAKGSAQFLIPGAPSTKNGNMTVTEINDYGGFKEHRTHYSVKNTSGN